MNRRNRIAALIAAMSIAALTGCAGSPPHPDPKPLWSPSASGTAIPTEPASAGPLEDGLTWESGLKMVGEAGGGYFATFMNPLVGGRAGWTEIPELTEWDGGSWSYWSTTTSCTIKVFQGTISDATMVPGDDRASTLEVIKVLFGEAYSAVAPSVTDVAISYGAAGPLKEGLPKVDMLSATGSTATHSTVIWVRAFTSISETTFLNGQCESPSELPTLVETFNKFGMIGY